MKRYWMGWVPGVVAAILLAGGCGKNNPVGMQTEQPAVPKCAGRALSVTAQSAFPYGHCGQPVEMALVLCSRNTTGGVVTVWNDDRQLHVRYDAQSGLKLNAVHLAVVADDMALVPHETNGNPALCQFPYQRRFSAPESVWTFDVPLTWQAGTRLVIAAHADLASGSASLAESSAWGDGCPLPGNSSATYFVYVVQAGAVKPSTTATPTPGEGALIFILDVAAKDGYPNRIKLVRGSTTLIQPVRTYINSRQAAEFRNLAPGDWEVCLEYCWGAGAYFDHQAKGGPIKIVEGCATKAYAYRTQPGVLYVEDKPAPTGPPLPLASVPEQAFGGLSLDMPSLPQTVTSGTIAIDSVSYAFQDNLPLQSDASGGVKAHYLSSVMGKPVYAGMSTLTVDLFDFEKNILYTGSTPITVAPYWTTAIRGLLSRSSVLFFPVDPGPLEIRRVQMPPFIP